ncbi:MAG: T9SS type A sorting domain-containing protein [Chitinophagales bacterium]|nr:T9SS type A sorting domain-containing protein [Chitinophagales bacterium]
MPIRLIAFLFAGLFYNQLFATHILGGYITYQYVSGTTYTVQLTLYRDCSSATPFDGAPGSNTSAIVGMFNESDSLVDVFPVIDPVITRVVPALDSQCVYPYPFCMEKGVYTLSVTLPDTGEYLLVHERCCLSGSVSNVFDPGSYGFVVRAKIQDGNNSPTFNITPPLFVSVNDSFSFNNWCVDLDGDSISYALVTPSSGGSVTSPAPDPPLGPPFDTIPWQNGFTFNKPLGADTTFSLNQNTGAISGIASSIGSFLIGTKVTEYRNGQVLAEYPLGFTLNVTDCNYQPTAIPGAIHSNSISFYPNPTKNEITITGLNKDELAFELADLRGKSLLKQTVSESNNHVCGLNQFAPGIYFIRCGNGLFKKIVVE